MTDPEVLSAMKAFCSLFSVLYELLSQCRISLSVISRLSPHLCEELIHKAQGMSTAEVEKLIATIAPKPDVTDKITPLTVQDSLPFFIDDLLSSAELLGHLERVSFGSRIENCLSLLRAEHRYRELRAPRLLSFIHNDYLGIADHPSLKEAGARALEIQGAGSRGSRLLGGESALIGEVECKLAAFFEAPSALFFSCGYLANLAACQVLGGLADHIVSDERIHASLIDGIHLARRPKTILAHNRWSDLPEALLGKRLLLVAESLYSMDGDLVEERSLRRCLETSDSFLLLDEAHAAGVLLENGKGFCAPWRDWSRMAVVVTFGKAFGVSGAAILTSSPLRELLINTARSFIYTTAPPAAVVAMVGAALQVIEEEGWRREELWHRASKVRAILSQARSAKRCPLREPASRWEERSPIIAFHIPGEDRALRFCESMRQSGIELRAIRYPTVARGSERVRISLSLSVSRENTEIMAKEVTRQWMAFS